MMSLSRTTGYAIQALSCLNDPRCASSHIADIAKRSGIPRPYLAKVISALTQKGLVCAKRGCRGGIALARSPQDISLLEIVEAVEGEHWLGECLIGFEDCSKHFTCPTQKFWQRMRLEIIFELRHINLADVLSAKGMKAKPALSNRPTVESGHPKARIPARLQA